MGNDLELRAVRPRCSVKTGDLCRRRGRNQQGASPDAASLEAPALKRSKRRYCRIERAIALAINIAADHLLADLLV